MQPLEHLTKSSDLYSVKAMPVLCNEEHYGDCNFSHYFCADGDNGCHDDLTPR